MGPSHSHMSDPRKQAYIEEFMRKSLLGEELVDTQFHLFSARSSLAGRVLKPRVLCVNNVLLAKSSKYFLDLLSADIHPSDASLVDLADDHDVPGNAQVDEYGYESDSDLDECDESILVTPPESQKDQSASKDDRLSDDGPGPVRSDRSATHPERPREEGAVDLDRPGSIASSETTVQEHVGDSLKELTMRKQTAVRLRSLASRHILVKDTAFQTWYVLLNYLYTGKFNFLPLKSTMSGGHPPSMSSLDEPKCSAKSMYRLARKVGVDHLRDEAFAYIRSNITEHNIVEELSCSILSTHSELLEMELDVLYANIDSAPVIAQFPDLARRIASKEMAHGADIIIGIHRRLLKTSPSRISGLGSRPWQTAQSGFGPRDAESTGDVDRGEHASTIAGDTPDAEAKVEDRTQRKGVTCDPPPNAGPIPFPSFPSTKVPEFSFDPSPTPCPPESSSGLKAGVFRSTFEENLASILASTRSQPSQATTSSNESKAGVACDPPPAPSFAPPKSTFSEANADDFASRLRSAWAQPSSSTLSEANTDDFASRLRSAWAKPPSSSESKPRFSFDTPPASWSEGTSFFEKGGQPPPGEEKTGAEESGVVPPAKFFFGEGPIKISTPSVGPNPFSFGPRS